MTEEQIIFQFADEFFSGLQTEKVLVNRLGKVSSKEVNNSLLLEPHDTLLCRYISLEFSDASHPSRFVNGVIFDFRNAIHISQAELEKKWGEYRVLPQTRGGLPSRQYLVSGNLYQGYLLFSHGPIERYIQDLPVHKLIVRRFDEKAYSKNHLNIKPGLWDPSDVPRSGNFAYEGATFTFDFPLPLNAGYSIKELQPGTKYEIAVSGIENPGFVVEYVKKDMSDFLGQPKNPYNLFYRFYFNSERQFTMQFYNGNKMAVITLPVDDPESYAPVIIKSFQFGEPNPMINK